MRVKTKVFMIQWTDKEENTKTFGHTEHRIDYPSYHFG